MIDHHTLEFRRLDPPWHWFAPLLGGFLYWLMFLLALEPDNALRASQAGYVLPFGLETIRITERRFLGRR